MSVVAKTECRGCGAPLDDLFSLGKQEIINLGDKEPLRAPLDVKMCSNCSLVQLGHNVDPDYLFRTYYYRSGATQTMKDHLQELAKDVEKRQRLTKESIIVDIGANDGTLLDSYDAYPDDILKIGFDPANGMPEPHYRAVMVNNFFTAETYHRTTPWKADVITAIACFYDLDDPLKFLKDIKKVLAKDGLFVIQVNYLLSTLANKSVGDFCHEHLCYYTLRTMEHLLFRAGLQAEDVSFNDINGGSMRVYVRHRTTAPPSATVSGVLAGETKFDRPEPFLTFYSDVMERARRVHSFLMEGYADVPEVPRKVFDIVGASTRGATFIQLARLKGRFTIERDASKVCKTYLGMPIVSEELANRYPPDYKLVSPTWFLDEVRKRESSFVEGGGGLVVPLPEPKLITKAGVIDLP